MPSFGVNNNHPYSLDDTYRRYLPIALHFGRRGSYDLKHENVVTTCKPTSLFMIAFVFISCIAMSWSFILEYFLYNKPNIYNNYYLYYINYAFIITARLSFLFLWTRIFPILPNTKSVIQKCKKFSIAMTILIISISIGAYLTNLWYKNLNDNVNKNGLSLIPNDKDTNSSTLCSQFIECRLTDSLSFYALFIQFTLIFLIFITFFVHQRQFGSFRGKKVKIININRKKHKTSKSRKRTKSHKKAAIALLETHDDDNIDVDINDEYKSDEDMNININMNEPYLMLYDEDDFDDKNELQSLGSFKAMKIKILWFQIGSFAVFLMLWIIHYLFGILHENFIQKYFFKIYILFVMIMCILKKILKTTARKLDGLRMGNVATSFEYLCEFYCNAMYWILFRQFIVYHIVFNDDYIYKFIIILLIHLSMELFSFLFRSSDWYFDNTNDLLHELQQRQEPFYQWIYKKLNDDSNIYQWRTRLSFDLIIRINICLITAIIQQIYLLLMIPSIYSTIYTDFINVFDKGFNDSMFIKATMYNVSSVLAEILLYLITMILFYKWHWINIWQSFENMVSPTMGNKIILLYWMISIISIY